MTQPVPPPSSQSAPLTMSRGDNLIFNIQIENPVPSLPTSPPPPVVFTNITGWKLWFTAKRNFADPDNLAISQQSTAGLSVPAGGSVTITNALEGLAQINMPPAATLGFADAPETIYYDVQAMDTLGNIFTVENGTITVWPDVTRTLV